MLFSVRACLAGIGLIGSICSIAVPVTLTLTRKDEERSRGGGCQIMLSLS
ncbi:hypothetical protein MHM_04790 [Candidatus Mycoplasma haemominutum 'Birmingham 1']|uniref:Uncharacterized protein n=1 Tax=Candidatus Mycoplasma haematominutum 'Birmingham 1' TaxID=1116213 RepID=G8C3U9_9MOLU|nr:hypothetical protein MHM_04790 [Candidatus Mycoplasma haematominutum 'Birmingham 1']